MEFDCIGFASFLAHFFRGERHRIPEIFSPGPPTLPGLTLPLWLPARIQRPLTAETYLAAAEWSEAAVGFLSVATPLTGYNPSATEWCVTTQTAFKSSLP